MDKEQIKLSKIDGFDHHFVTSDGRILTDNYRRKGEWEELSPGVCSSGYKIVHLVEGDKDETRRVHRLVLETFKQDEWIEAQKKAENEESRVHARHLNGDKHDNRVENLAWGTAKDNAEDAKRLGER